MQYPPVNQVGTARVSLEVDHLPALLGCLAAAAAKEPAAFQGAELQVLKAKWKPNKVMENGR